MEKFVKNSRKKKVVEKGGTFETKEQRKNGGKHGVWRSYWNKDV